VVLAVPGPCGPAGLSTSVVLATGRARPQPAVLGTFQEALGSAGLVTAVFQDAPLNSGKWGARAGSSQQPETPGNLWT
jgi:hypothetical protein